MALSLTTPFYHQILRRYHVAFGSLFSQISILRDDVNGVESQRLVVPIEYSQRESWLTRLRSEPELKMRTQEVQPRLAFEMTGVRYDPTRKINALNARGCAPFAQDKNSAYRYFSGTPYILTFALYALTRNIEDANQILEQVLPAFTPDYTLLVNIIPSLGIKDRMRIVLDGNPIWADSWEADGFPKTRQIVQTFTFNVAATFYGPIPTTPPNIIRTIIVDLYGATGAAVLSDPNYLKDTSGNRLNTESDFKILDESSESDLRQLAKLTRMTIEPNPIDALPIKPIETTTTTINFVAGEDTDVLD